MDCDTVRDLLPEFALGALPANEEVQVRAHLAECDAHVEAVELRAAAIGLAGTAEEREAPAGARERLMDALSAEAASDAAAPGRAPTPPSHIDPGSSGSAGNRGRWPPRWR